MICKTTLGGRLSALPSAHPRCWTHDLLLDPARNDCGLPIGGNVDWFRYLFSFLQMTMDNDDNTTLEVVRDDQGSAAWRECGPGGCTTSRQRLPRDGGYSIQVKALERMAQIEQEAAATFADFLAAIGLATTAMRWTIPTPWESKRRKRRARGRQIEARQKPPYVGGWIWVVSAGLRSKPIGPTTRLDDVEIPTCIDDAFLDPSLGQPWEVSDDV